MAFEERQEVDLYSIVAGRSAGLSFERMFRIYSYVLHGWATFEGERHYLPREPKCLLKAISFDKLVMFVSRLWNKAHSLQDDVSLGRDSETSTADRDAQILYPCPLIEKPGKHGPGMAVHDGRNAPVFVLPLIRSFQREGLISYFDITLPPGAESASDPDTTVGPGIPINSAREFLSVFTTREAAIINDLSNAFRHLTPSQIRCLGTHENVDKTIDWIRWEFDQVKKTGRLRDLQNRLTSGQTFRSEAQDVYEFMDEARRKAVDNRKEYSSGHRLFKAELSDPQLGAAFRACQSEPDGIWDDLNIASWIERSKVGRAFLGYLRAISMCELKDGRVAVPNGRIKKKIQDAVNDCQEVNISLPAGIEEIFEADRLHVRPGLLRVFINLLVELEAQ